MRLAWFIFLLLTVLSGCDNSLEPAIGRERLVVQGWLTDQTGPFKVELTKTKQFNAPGNFPAVTGANVTIIDDLGEPYRLSVEAEPGKYQTLEKNLRGTIGRAYTLLVTLPDGTQYQSEPELLKGVAQIDQLEPVFDLAGLINLNLVFSLGLSIRYLDPPTRGNFYRWNLFADGNLLIPTTLILGDDRLLNGAPTQFEVTLPPVDINSILRVDQMSLTESAHNYLQQIKSQTEDLGKTFGVSPAQIRGNISNVNQTDEIVIGYFGASAITTAEIRF